MTIKGFNQSESNTMGSITLPVRLGELETKVLFYVIDVDTSYRALLGRLWLNKYKVVPSTLHQCLKYVEKGASKACIPFRCCKRVIPTLSSTLKRSRNSLRIKEEF